MYSSHRISVVVPVFNEVDVLALTYGRLIAVLDSFDYELMFVDDGSRDGSLALLASLALSNDRVKVLSLSRNFGHQPAVSAGLHYATGDAVVLIDADLQDPPEIIPAMVTAWEEGYDVVYGVRQSRDGESWLKRLAAHLFYRFLRRASDVEIPIDSGDFRLLSRTVVDVINGMPERNRFMRGMTAWVGFRQTGVFYQRAARAAGESKYPWHKMWRLSLDAITGFSTAPLRWVFRASLTVAMVAFLGSMWLLYQRVSYPKTSGLVIGWTSLILTLLWLGSFQLGAIAIIGKYLGHVVDQVRQRPLYVVARTWNVDGATTSVLNPNRRFPISEDSPE